MSKVALHSVPVPARDDSKVRSDEVMHEVLAFLTSLVQIPRGIAIPFAVQQQFLESSPRIQQTIGKLKMALELNAREIEPLCLSLQQQIREHRMPESMRTYIDGHISEHLSGVSSFVVRSSSNAEDLAGFSAAGWTDLVLGPDRPARAVTGLISGLHAPEASHLLLLEAVAGPNLVAQAYRAALSRDYLWHEFGDSTLFLP